MKRIDLVRIVENGSGTFGVLVDYDVMRNEPFPFALTLELRWRNNIRQGSCIPAGTYTCKRIISPRFGETFEIADVPERDNILFHSGNTVNDSSGCVLIAKEYGKLDLFSAILNSKKGFNEFLERTKGFDSFELNIFQTLLTPGYSKLKLY